jgi:hypothetical protein
LTARLGAVEARGWALAGDQHQARAAIRRADAALDRSDPSADPPWLAAYTPAHHAGSVMHALRDLHRHREAATLSGMALDLPESNVRARALHQTLLATVQARNGDLDAACGTAGLALRTAVTISSARLGERLREFARQVGHHRDHPAVRDFTEQAALMLPRI